MQVTSTNANESWHLVLKSAGKMRKGNKPSYSLGGVLVLIEECAVQFDRRADKRALDAELKKLSESFEYSFLNLFPATIQFLLLEEIRSAKKKFYSDHGETRELGTDFRCECHFRRAYLLPCEHEFSSQYLHRFTPPDYEIDWKAAADQFDESGMEIYWTRTKILVSDEEVFDRWDIQMTHQINNGEKLELIRTRFHEIAEYAATKGPEKQGRILQAWSDGIDKICGDWCAGNMQEWLGEHINFGDDDLYDASNIHRLC